MFSPSHVEVCANFRDIASLAIGAFDIAPPTSLFVTVLVPVLVSRCRDIVQYKLVG